MKNLEIEYKKQIASELPDLWSRIEAGVDAYEASKNTVADEKSVVDEKITTKEVVEKKTIDETINTAGNKKTAKKNNKTVIYAFKIVAAAACLLVVVNVVAMFGSRKNESATAMTDSIAFTADSAASEECATEEYAADECAPAATADEAVEEVAESSKTEINGVVADEECIDMEEATEKEMMAVEGEDEITPDAVIAECLEVDLETAQQIVNAFEEVGIIDICEATLTDEARSEGESVRAFTIVTLDGAEYYVELSAENITEISSIDIIK